MDGVNVNIKMLKDIQIVCHGGGGTVCQIKVQGGHFQQKGHTNMKSL